MSENSNYPGAESAVPPAPQPNPYAPPAYPGQSHNGGQQAPPYGAQQVQPYSAQQPYGGQLPYGGQQPYDGMPPSYAAQQPYAAGQPYAAPRPASGLAVTSLVTGIAGLLLSFFAIPLLASIVAVITGHMALKRSRQNSAIGGRGLAIAGLILGYIGIAILAIIIVVGIFSVVLIGTAGLVPFLMD